MTYEGFAKYVGRMETEAKSVEKARQNLRYRLWKEHGWNRYEAMRADVDPIRLVSK